MLWSKCSHNLCVLLQVGIVSTWVGNARMNTPKLRMASTGHLFLVSAWVFKPTKMGREVFCLFRVSEVMTALVTWYYGKQSIAKLTAQPYFMVIAWLLIALSHTVQSVWNLLMFSKLVELMIHLEFFFFFNFYFKFLLEHFRHQNCWSISDSVLHAIFKASPVSLLNTRLTSLPRCVETRSDPADFLRCAHKLLFAPHSSGGKNTAGQSMAC